MPSGEPIHPESLKEALRPYYLKWVYFPLFPRRKPAYFSECWKYPALALNGEVQEWTGRPSSEPDLLFLPMTDWHTRIQRTQHLARSFAALGNRCFYLNPHLGREFPHPSGVGERLRLNHLGSRIVELHVHLPREPVFHHRLLTRRENDQLATSLTKFFSVSGTRRLIQIVSFPLWLTLAKRLKEEFQYPIIYDCHDVLSGFSSISPDIVAAEKELFAASDLIAFSSQHLMDSSVALYPQLKNKSILVRNAVDVRGIKGIDTDPEVDLKPPVPRWNSVTVGYVGALDTWFDLEAVEAAAGRHPEWRIFLVGRVEDPRLRALSRFPNVQFTGEVPYAELHRYLPAFDVAMIPFRRNPLTMGTNPIKIYEYFSFGLPVVSTRLPEMEAFGTLAYLADTPAEFVDQLERAAAEKSPSLREDRIRFAGKETWTARAIQLSKAFDSAVVG